MSDPIPFPYKPNATGTLRDSVRFATDIRTSYSQREQRAALRATPDGAIEFTVPMFDPVKAGKVFGLLWAHHADQWIVPLWKYAARTLTALSGGETEIPCVPPVAGHGLEILPWQQSPGVSNPFVMLWENESHWQVLQWSGISGSRGWGADWDLSWGRANASVPDSVVVLGGVQGFGKGWSLAWDKSWGHASAGGVAFPAGCLLIPCRAARIDPSLVDSTDTLEVAAGRYLWTIDETADTASTSPAATGPMYLGREVFTRMPNRVLQAQEKQDVAVLTLDSTTGPRQSEAQSRTPARARELDMPAFDLFAAYELRQFLYRVAGRQRGFWLPSWLRNFVITAGASIGVSTVQVAECGYATTLFPSGLARRYVGFLGAAGAIQVRKITDATTDGVTETLTLDVPLSVAVTTQTLAMFMRYMRLDDDEVSFEWDGGICFVKLPVRDLSEEIAIVEDLASSLTSTLESVA